MTWFDRNSSLNVARSFPLLPAVAKYLQNGGYDQTFCLDKFTDEDMFYLVVRDADDRHTVEDKIQFLSMMEQYRGGFIYSNGRAMFETLWRLTSYARKFVPLISSLISATGWQEIARILIDYDHIPEWHYPIMLRTCLVFGGWALLDIQREHLEEEYDTYKKNNDFSLFCIDDLKENEASPFYVPLIEAFGAMSLAFVKRDILDLLRDDGDQPNEVIATTALQGSIDVGSAGFECFVSLDQAKELVQKTRNVLAHEQAIQFVAVIDAI